MARLKSLRSAPDKDDQVPTVPAASSTSATSSAPVEPTGSQRAGRRGAGTDRPRKTTQRPPNTATVTELPAPAGTTSVKADNTIRVRAVDAAGAKRVSLYLDPDDYRALAMAKLDDGADMNSRIRALIAVWRGDSRVAKKVNRLAQTAPRGGQR